MESVERIAVSSSVFKYVCVCVCPEGVRLPGDGVIGNCKTPALDVGIQTQDLHRRSMSARALSHLSSLKFFKCQINSALPPSEPGLLLVGRCFNYYFTLLVIY